MENRIYDKRLKLFGSLDEFKNVVLDNGRIANIKFNDSPTVYFSSTKKIFNTDSTFGLPSAESLYYNIASKRSSELGSLKGKIFNERYKGLIQDSRVFDYFEVLIESIVLSIMCLETFSNHSIPDDYYYEEKNKDKDSNLWIAKNKINIERSLSLDIKLHIILPKIFGCKSPKGLNQWKMYKRIKKLRDNLVHFKTSSGIHLSKIKDSIWDDLLDVDVSPSQVVKDLIICYYKDTAIPKWLE